MAKSINIVESTDLSFLDELFPEGTPRRLAQDPTFAMRLSYTSPAERWTLASADVAGRGSWYGRRPETQHLFQIAAAGAQYHHGSLLDQGRLAIHAPGSEMVIHTPAHCAWVILGLEPALAGPLLAPLAARAGQEARPLRILRLAPRGWRRLSAAMQAAAAEAAAAPVGGPPPERHLAPLLEALGLAIRSGRLLAPSRTSRTILRAEEVLARAGTRRVRLLELAEAAGIGERALRQAFLKAYGMGPVELLKARQLCLARLRLRLSNRRASVSAVAAELGIFSFGRFAVEYRRLFGESPSRTLARGRGPGRSIG